MRDLRCWSFSDYAYLVCNSFRRRGKGDVANMPERFVFRMVNSDTDTVPALILSVPDGSTRGTSAISKEKAV